MVVVVIDGDRWGWKMRVETRNDYATLYWIVGSYEPPLTYRMVGPIQIKWVPEKGLFPMGWSSIVLTGVDAS